MNEPFNVAQSQLIKAERLAELHGGKRLFCTLNPWDVGSARLFEGLGAVALATSSAGLALSLGRADYTLKREEVLTHIGAISASTTIPLTADLESGFGSRPEDVFDTFVLAARAGAVGGSIEDSSGDDGRPILDIEFAIERVTAAVEAARSLPFKFAVIARAEQLLYQPDSIASVIERLQRFQDAGADVLFAPGLLELRDIESVVRAVDRPVNVMVGLPDMRSLTLQQLENVGVRRVSAGAAFARIAYEKVARSVEELLLEGSLRRTSDAMRSSEILRLFEP